MIENLTYAEPGVYVSSESAKKKVTNDNSVKMYPLIIGRIPQYVPKTLTIVRTDATEAIKPRTQNVASSWLHFEAEEGLVNPNNLSSSSWAKSWASGGAAVIATQANQTSESNTTINIPNADQYDIYATIALPSNDISNRRGGYEFSIDGSVFYKKYAAEISAVNNMTFIRAWLGDDGYEADVQWVKIGSSVDLTAGDHSFTSKITKGEGTGALGLGVIDCIRFVPSSWNWVPTDASFAEPVDNSAKVMGDIVPNEYSQIESIDWARNAYNSWKAYDTNNPSCFTLATREVQEQNGEYRTETCIKWYNYSNMIEFRHYPVFTKYQEKPEGWGTNSDMEIYLWALNKTPELIDIKRNGWPEFIPNVYCYYTPDKYDVIATRYVGADEYTEGGKLSGNILTKTFISGGSFRFAINSNYHDIQIPEDVTYSSNIKYYTHPSVSNVDNGSVPPIGSSYRIKLNFVPNQDSEYYKIQEFSKVEDVANFYGEDTIAVDYSNGIQGFNPIPVAAKIAKEAGSPAFYTLGVENPEYEYAGGSYRGGPWASDPLSGAWSFANYRLGDEVAVATGSSSSPGDKTRMILIHFCGWDGNGNKDYLPNKNICFKMNYDGTKYLTVDGLEIAPVRLKAYNEQVSQDYPIGIPAAYQYQIDIDKMYAEYYKKALSEKCADIEAEALYRIIPLDQGEQISKAVNDHVNEFSSDEERMECSGLASLPYNTMNYISYDAYTDAVVSFAKSTNNHRMITSFGNATRTLSDGTQVLLSTQYLFVYLAALEQTKKDGTGLTNLTIPLSTFTNLDIPAMRRTRKNEIASAGVLIFEQRPSAAEIKVRHALTTKTSDTYGKEMSVQYNIDYTRKYLRTICNPYIGRRNVNPETLELVEETITEGLETLVKEGRLTKGVIDRIGIAEDAEDTIVVVIKVAVSFPLNYIYITLVLDN